MILVITRKPKKKVNLQMLAIDVSRREGGKVNLPIAQVSEVQRHVLDLLAEELRRNPKGVIALLKERGG